MNLSPLKLLAITGVVLVAGLVWMKKREIDRADPRRQTGDSGIVMLVADWCGYCQRAQPLLAAGPVEEEVGRDAVEPPLEGPGGVAVEGAEDPHEDVVREVLRVVDVTGQAVGQSVDALTVLLDDLGPGRRDPWLLVGGASGGFSGHAGQHPRPT